jgi:transposase-like protein
VLVELGVTEQRYRAVLEVLDEGVPVTEVARRYRVARQTVHDWLRRFASDGGLAGLADRSSRPGSCPHQMSAVAEARVRGLRRAHPGVGPSRIVWQLERVEADDQLELRTFAAGIRQDLAAVIAGLSLPYSSGATEGQRQPAEGDQTADVWPCQPRPAAQTRHPSPAVT